MVRCLVSDIILVGMSVCGSASWGMGMVRLGVLTTGEVVGVLK